MIQINLKQLVGKLNSFGRRSLESAAGLCLSRTNYNVEIEHWLTRMIDEPNTDVAAILQHFDVNTARLAADLTRAIDRIKTGSSRSPAMSPDLIEMVRAGWLIGSIDFQATSTRTGHLLCALLSEFRSKLRGSAGLSLESALCCYFRAWPNSKISILLVIGR